MNRDRVEEVLRALVSNVAGLSDLQLFDLQLDTTFSSELDFNAIDMEWLAKACEEEFRIDVKDPQLDSVLTFGDLVELVWSKLCGGERLGFTVSKKIVGRT